jgi:hypothetical protein
MIESHDHQDQDLKHITVGALTFRPNYQRP